MKVSSVGSLRIAGFLGFLLALLGSTPVWAVAAKLDNTGCLSCHEGKREKIEIPGKDDEKRTLAHVDARKFGKSVHAEMQCVACHTDITDNQAKHNAYFTPS
jgi:hypothetical protein